MRTWAVVRFILSSILRSKRGWTGLLFVLLGVLWNGLAALQTIEFLTGYSLPISDLLASRLGAFVFMGLGFIVLYKVVADRLPEIQTLEAQERRHRQDALKEWRDTLTKWVVDRDNPLTEAEFYDPRRKAARGQTLEVLKQQDPEGKKSVLLILYDWSLIRRYPFPIIDLSHADFSNAHLEGVDLQGANLSRVNLKDADLSGARLGRSPENISKMERAARVIRTIAGDLTNSAYTCDLQGAKLSGAILKDAVLVGCVLVGADFEGADLDSADLRGANLRAALNLTQGQVNKAYGSYQQEGIPDTQLPEDYLEAPKAWKKPLSQQMAEREASSS